MRFWAEDKTFSEREWCWQRERKEMMWTHRRLKQPFEYTAGVFRQFRHCTRWFLTLNGFSVTYEFRETRRQKHHLTKYLYWCWLGISSGLVSLLSVLQLMFLRCLLLSCSSLFWCPPGLYSGSTVFMPPPGQIMYGHDIAFHFSVDDTQPYTTVWVNMNEETVPGVLLVH